MNRFELFVALRYLRSRSGSRLLSLSSAIAMGGVAIAVAALVVTIGVMNGLQTDLRDKLLIGSPDIRLQNYGAELVMSDWESMIDRVKRQSGVVAVAPFVYTQAVVGMPKRKLTQPVVIEGTPPDGSGSANVTSLREHLVSGDFSFATSDGERNGAVIGERLAERFNLVVGRDSINVFTVSSSTIDPVSGFPRPNAETFAVTGVFETGLYDYDENYVLVSLNSAQRLAQLGDAVSGLEVRAPSRADAAVVARRLADTLAPLVKVTDWNEQFGSFFAALRLEKLGMTLVLLIIVLVSAFNIANTLIMVVTEKTHEIGILRAMGMKSASIRRIFFIQGIVIGLVGTCAGLAVGLSAAVLIGTKRLITLDPSIFFIDHLPVAIQSIDVTMIAVASLLIAGLATVYPARQATRLYPVDAIRHD